MVKCDRFSYQQVIHMFQHCEHRRRYSTFRLVKRNASQQPSQVYPKRVHSVRQTHQSLGPRLASHPPPSWRRTRPMSKTIDVQPPYWYSSTSPTTSSDCPFSLSLHTAFHSSTGLTLNNDRSFKRSLHDVLHSSTGLTLSSDAPSDVPFIMYFITVLALL